MVSLKETTTETPLEKRIAQVSFFLAVAIIIVASLVLIGWYFNIPYFTSIYPNWIAMRFNTALCFICSGFSLIFLKADPKNYLKINGGKVLAAFVGLMGLITFFQFISGYDLGIDFLFFKPMALTSGNLGTLPSGRMAPNTALNFVFISLALIFSYTRKPTGIMLTQALSWIIILVSMPAFIGYCYGAQFLYGLAYFTQMAIHTSISFLIFGIAIGLSNMRVGFMSIFARKDAGGVIARKLLPLVVSIPLLVDFLVLQGLNKKMYGFDYAMALAVICSIVFISIVVMRNAFVVSEMESQLLASNNNLEKMVEERTIQFLQAQSLAHLGSWEYEGAKGKLFWSDELFKIMGIPLNTPIDFNTYFALVHPEDVIGVKQKIEFYSMYPGHFSFEHRIQRSDGEIRYLLCQGEVCADEEGKISRIIGTSQDITDRKMLENEREYTLKQFIESEQRTRLLLNSTAEAIYGIDLDGNCTFANITCMQILGFDNFNELIGVNMHNLIHSKNAEGVHVPSCDCKILKAYALGEVAHIDDEVFWNKDGVSFPVEYWSHPIVENGETLGAVITFFDITERKAIENELIKAREGAFAAATAKSNFLSNMSHEIRTPMNAIIGMADLLSETQLNNDQDKFVGTLKKAGENLLVLVNDILDFSKIESLDLKLELIEFDLHEVVNNAVELMTPRAHVKGLELLTNFRPEAANNLIGDPHRIRQILMNLISNAIKFTEFGEVVLRIEKDPESTSAGAVIISVVDTGIGIPKDKLGDLFERFTQADASVTRKYGGTGLGLSISRKLVELMGGKMGIESIEGKGSRFYFTLDLLTHNRVPIDSSLKDFNLQGIKVLIVDDNGSDRLILQEILTSWGANPSCAKNGEEALIKLHDSVAPGQVPFELLLLDQRMPGLNGFELFKMIADIGNYKDLITMMITSDDGSQMKAQARDLGITNYLVKPIKKMDLWSTIGNAYLKPQKPSSVIKISPVEIGELPEDSRQLKILLVDDSEDNRALVLQYLKKTPYLIETADNGAVAVEKYSAGEFDLILMDMQMPIMDGYTATKTIRDLEQAKGRTAIPIIALTAYALHEDANKSQVAGCNTHVTKPVKKQTLLQIIWDQTKHFKTSSTG